MFTLRNALMFCFFSGPCLVFAANVDAAPPPARPNPFFAYAFDAHGLSPEEQAKMLKELGYAGIGWGKTRISEMLKKLDVYGLKMFSIYVAADVDPDKPAYDPALKEAIEQLKGHDTVIWLQVNGGTPSMADSDERAVSILREIVEAAEKSGLRVALYPHVGAYVARIEDGIRLVKKVDRKNLGVCFNLCHFLKLDDEKNIESRLKEALPCLFAVNINGADSGNTREMDWGRLIQPLDRGTFDVRRMLATLDQLGYAGPIGLQCFGIPGDCRENLERSMSAWRRQSLDEGAQTAVSSLIATWNNPPPAFPSGGSTGAPLLGNGNMAACLGGPADKLRVFITRNDFWRLTNSDKGAQKLAGILDIHIAGLKDASYHLNQTISDGVVKGTFTKGALTVELTCWLDATEDMMVVKLRAQGGETSVELALTAPGDPPSKTESGATIAIAWGVRKFAKEVAIPSESATVLRVLGEEGLNFTLKPGVPVTLALVTTSAFQQPQPLKWAKQHIGALTPAKIAHARASHDQWWAQYWNRSWVQVGDPLLMKGYYQGLYTLAACSRNPKFPPGIFGPWITADQPAWSNDYHLNYNFVAPFYGLYSANRLKQADPQDSPILDFMPRGRWYAENVTKTRGVLYPVGIGPLGTETTRGGKYGNNVGGSEQEGLFLHQRSNAAYCLVNIAQRWRCTYDPAYAKKVYPLVLAVADFWEDYLKLVDGKYQIYGDAIHELSGWNKNPILTLGLLRNSFDLVLDMSQALNLDAGRREKWKSIHSNLADFPLQERNGKTVFRYTDEGPAWVDGNTLGIQHIYPGNAITLDSNLKLLEISRNTLAAMNRWHDGNGANSFFPAAVRIGADPNVILEQLRRYTQDTYPNGFRNGNIHGIENCSTVHNTIDEMLCMSVGHVLRLFPVWPKDKNAKFVNLRAWGAFLVSAELKDGVVHDVRIVSEKGRSCIVQNPWPGKSVKIVRNGDKAETLAGERLSLKTAVGETIALMPTTP